MRYCSSSRSDDPHPGTIKLLENLGIAKDGGHRNPKGRYRVQVMIKLLVSGRTPITAVFAPFTFLLYRRLNDIYCSQLRVTQDHTGSS